MEGTNLDEGEGEEFCLPEVADGEEEEPPDLLGQQGITPRGAWRVQYVHQPGQWGEGGVLPPARGG